MSAPDADVRTAWAGARPRRWRLDSRLSPAQAARWLRDDADPVALVGEWCDVDAILGSEPVAAVAGAAALDQLDRVPRVAGGDGVAVGGGAIGRLSYPLGHRFEELPSDPPAPVPRETAAVALYDHVVVHTDTGWWLEALWTPERGPAIEARLACWRHRLRSSPPPAPAPDALAARFADRPPGLSGHRAAVAQCIERIHRGEIFQANVCLRLDASTDADPLERFLLAIDSRRPRFGAYLEGTISLSPERFLRRRGRTVTAEPIKGTRPRVGDAARQADTRAALLHSSKDRAEHVMIVDLMRNDLGRVCEYGTVIAADPRVEAHDGVWHLVSTVTGRLRDGVGDGQLLRATFPPGSVTGAPKVQAMTVIASLEATRREAYAGAIGIASPVAGLDLNVAIRTLEQRGDRLWMGVGGGIVADSDPDAEVDEALAKAAGPVAAVGGELAAPVAARGRRVGARGRQVAARGRRVAVPPALRAGNRPDPSAGVFETVLVDGGRAVDLGAHLARLDASLDALYGRRLPDDVERRIRAAVAEADDRPRPRLRRLRITATCAGAIAWTLGPAASVVGPVALAPYLLPGGLGAHKWRDRSLLDALVAADERGRTPLIVDADGSVLEAAYANVWIREGGALLTPPADGRLLPGTTRATLLADDVSAREEPLTLDRLRAADAIVLSSSISGRVAATL